MEVTVEITQTEYDVNGTDVDDRIGVEVHEMCSSKIGGGSFASWLQLSFIDHAEIADVTLKLKDGCLLLTQEGTAEVLLANLWKDD